jgi:uncharacterized membrane protein
MIPWDQLHGAMTHFPIALLPFSAACDFASVVLHKFAFARELRRVSYYGLAFSAIASVGAVASGIALYWQHNGRKAEDKPRRSPKLLLQKDEAFFCKVARTAMAGTQMEARMHPAY